MNAALMLLLWRMGTYDPVDYDVDESDTFRAPPRGVKFDGQRSTLFRANNRATLLQADTGKTERA